MNTDILNKDEFIIDRFRDTGIVTMGNIYTHKGHESVCLEPSWANNQNWVSCIPTGIYEVVKYNSDKFGSCLLVKDVPGRSGILLHVYNYFWDTEGCIAPGERFGHLNKDGVPDVYSSESALSHLMKTLPDKSRLAVMQNSNFKRNYI